ncbi:hypothetical protein [Herbidospora yilanensis]|uniref:hypothetical protein n=1 Tax=Herbidospora yilanensis TaxID=354426 RepID=UPI000A4AD307|nr:hypothetical protein [Herbidospora yilanensis]
MSHVDLGVGVVDELDSFLADADLSTGTLRVGVRPHDRLSRHDDRFFVAVSE